MKTIILADKFSFMARFFVFAALMILPFSAQAEYYLVYGPSGVPACDYYVTRHYHRPVHKVHRVHRMCSAYNVRRDACGHYPTRRPGRYSLTVYYPVATYIETPCMSCGGFIAPTYYWVPAPANRVYYAHPDDRLVGNRYEDNFDPSVDTGTADNDIY